MNNSELLSYFTPPLTLSEPGFAFHFTVFSEAGRWDFSGVEVKTWNILVVRPRSTIPELLGTHGPTLIHFAYILVGMGSTLYLSSGYFEKAKKTPKTHFFSNQQFLKPSFIVFPLDSYTSSCSFRFFSGLMLLCICALHMWEGRRLQVHFIRWKENWKQEWDFQGPGCHSLAGPGAFLICSVKFLSICWLTGFLTFCLLPVSGHRSSSARVCVAEPDSGPVHRWLAVSHSPPRRELRKRHQGYKVC